MLLILSGLLLTIPHVAKVNIDWSRLLLTFFSIGGTIAVTLSRKMFGENNPGMEAFYQPRTALLIFAIIPFAIFHFRERFVFIASASFSFLALVFFDPIHNLAGVGYYQMGFQDPNYYFSNLIFVFIYFFLLGIVFFFKKSMEDYEALNQRLLIAQQQKNQMIEQQKEELESQSDLLKRLLNEKDKDLIKVADELVKFNHELLQYSYAISHNLRGPLATLLGLINLLKQSGLDEKQQKLVMLSHQSSQALDIIIHDLNRIVDLRKDTYHVREKVSFREVVDEVLLLLKPAIQSFSVRIQLSLDELPSLYSSRERIHYILFCLLNNSIQYRKPDFNLQIKVRSFSNAGYGVLEIEDNGQGIDLVKFGDHIFKPFKRFHISSSGKGIGLYLLKLQVEKLYGKIEVKSTPGVGTIFRVYLKDLQKEWDNSQKAS